MINEMCCQGIFQNYSQVDSMRHYIFQNTNYRTLLEKIKSCSVLSISPETNGGDIDKTSKRAVFVDKKKNRAVF